MPSLWLPPKPKEPEINRYGWKIFTLEYYWEHELESHLRADIEKAGGSVCGVVKVPAWNMEGQRIGDHFVLVYQAEKEIGVWVWT